ncbi:hypothetical protein [Mesorhizobium sp.]|uniref:hypothetical protein n=1 Tax=Mesorhizobium sp. TaxID=1871066 RepID=UPI0025D611B1|nr:hypothetical protein [Mesorhizobium sp.]
MNGSSKIILTATGAVIEYGPLAIADGGGKEQMSVDAGPRKADAEYAIEYLQEHPEAGFCCEERRWWITPNAKDRSAGPAS